MADEYQQMAGLVCLKIDLLSDIADDPTITLDELKAQIKLVADDVEKWKNDPAEREAQYACCSWIFSNR